MPFIHLGFQANQTQTVDINLWSNTFDIMYELDTKTGTSQDVKFDVPEYETLTVIIQTDDDELQLDLPYTSKREINFNLDGFKISKI